MIGNKYIDEYLKRERRENTQKTVDNSYSPRYNEDSRTTTYDLSDVWKKSNEKALRYAGDSAKESVDKGLKEASKFMKDAPEGTDYGKVQSASVKWRLANDANNKDLQQSAFNELTGHLSAENKEPYLNKARPLQEFVDAKDNFDYKHNNYTTTKNANKEFSVTTYDLQQFLNKEGHTDKFGNPLKEDGIYGGKTRFAEDSYRELIENSTAKKSNNEFAEKINSNIETSTLVHNLGSQEQPKATKLGWPKFVFKWQYPDFDIISEKYGEELADTALDHAIASYEKAQTYMDNNNIKGDAENVVDAFRHFVWNVALTRDVGIDKAKYITNLHEYLDIKNNNWLKSGDIDKGNLIRGKMNQSMLMDLWNNSVARTLASDKSYREKNVDELFEIAMNQNLIIEDVNKVYDFLGIKHCADQYTYTVNVMWNTTTGNITVYDINGKEFMTLKIGV